MGRHCNKDVNLFFLWRLGLDTILSLMYTVREGREDYTTYTKSDGGREREVFASEREDSIRGGK